MIYYTIICDIYIYIYIYLNIKGAEAEGAGREDRGAHELRRQPSDAGQTKIIHTTK